jgi:hypothetical protein
MTMVYSWLTTDPCCHTHTPSPLAPLMLWTCCSLMHSLSCPLHHSLLPTHPFIPTHCVRSMFSWHRWFSIERLEVLCVADALKVSGRDSEGLGHIVVFSISFLCSTPFYPHSSSIHTHSPLPPLTVMLGHVVVFAFSFLFYPPFPLHSPSIHTQYHLPTPAAGSRGGASWWGGSGAECIWANTAWLRLTGAVTRGYEVSLPVCHTLACITVLTHLHLSTSYIYLSPTPPSYHCHVVTHCSILRCLSYPLHHSLLPIHLFIPPHPSNAPLYQL